MSIAHFISDEDGEKIRDVLSYDPLTGNLTWIARTLLGKSGKVAGSKKGSGHLEVMVHGKHLLAHRVAWFLHYGYWPEGVIDHINRTPSDNRISNLRDVPQAANTHNISLESCSNRTGKTGVTLVGGQFRSEIEVSGRRINLGVFSTLPEAAASYMTAKKLLHKGFIQAL